MTKTTADVLDDAADLLERQGWCQVYMEDSDGRHCVVGALSAAAAVAHSRVAHAGAENAIWARVGMPTAWNDAPERTEQEVLDLLRSVAKDQRRIAEGLDL
jgi:hypothetical protein